MVISRKQPLYFKTLLIEIVAVVFIFIYLVSDFSDDFDTSSWKHYFRFTIVVAPTVTIIIAILGVLTKSESFVNLAIFLYVLDTFVSIFFILFTSQPSAYRVCEHNSSACLSDDNCDSHSGSWGTEFIYLNGLFLLIIA
jgi:purine-cytosine permease-like protein